MAAMYDIAEQVRSWLADGREVTVAQLVATRGFSSRDAGVAAAWTDGAVPVGSIVEGIDPLSVRGRGLVEVTLSDADAVAAGLSCGGTASLLVQPAAAYPVETWSLLADRAPVCLVTPLDGATEVYTPATIRDARVHSEEVPRLFGRGVNATAIVAGEPDVVVAALWPVPAMLVVGDGLIAAALRDTAALLGWSCAIEPEVGAAVAGAEALHASDALVVLSHDRDVDGPVLATALAARVGYVGALGSRGTQALRREWLTAGGVSLADQDRIHGPAGLDIDAHTPAEIAISIIAEILASRAGTTGGALRERSGPVHTGTVPAPSLRCPPAQSGDEFP